MVSGVWRGVREQDGVGEGTGSAVQRAVGRGRGQLTKVAPPRALSGGARPGHIRKTNANHHPCHGNLNNTSVPEFRNRATGTPAGGQHAQAIPGAGGGRGCHTPRRCASAGPARPSPAEDIASQWCAPPIPSATAILPRRRPPHPPAATQCVPQQCRCAPSLPVICGPPCGRGPGPSSSFPLNRTLPRAHISKRIHPTDHMSRADPQRGPTGRLHGTGAKRVGEAIAEL